MGIYEALDNRISELEERLSDTGYSMQKLVQSSKAKNWKILPQSDTTLGMHLALCIDTIDPWKQNRVRFFNPMFQNPQTPVQALPFAWPVSTFGGFDDSGVNWVPPAGSTLCLIYETGNRQAPFYIGTTWSRDRGPDGAHNFNFPIPEYTAIHEGHRKGYLAGPNDGSQVFPPWNTESYNGFDIDSIADFDDDPLAQQKITSPNIYGFKTPQKHAVKLVDGNPKCNHRHKRMEFFSSCGNYMIFKDDHIHYGGQWSSDKCNARGSSVEFCNDEDGNPTELLNCNGTTSNSTIIGGHPSTPNVTNGKFNLETQQGTNPFFKHENECRPIKGPGTPQNNKLELPQSGIQFLSISGHCFGMDDSVEEPQGIPEWERSLEDFDFGCNDKFLGKTFWVSATGHRIEMNDAEKDTGLRGEDNYIRIITPHGNKIELNDHTTGQVNAGCPPNIAGEKRGITLQTTSNHTIEMIDNENEQCGPTRKEGGKPNNKAKKAFIKIRTGYGLEMSFNDFEGGPDGAQGSQQETINQNIQIFSPQKDNSERGPHIMRFQERPSGPGQVYLRVGGDYIVQTFDSHVTTVGEPKNPANKILNVTKNNIIITKDIHFHKADIHALQADSIVLIMAGADCAPETGEECVPCVWPVLCMTPKGVTISDRVYVSASPEAECAHLTQLRPFHDCTPFEGC